MRQGKYINNKEKRKFNFLNQTLKTENYNETI